MRLPLTVAASLIAMTAPRAATAQEASSARCELHVWPAAAMKMLRSYATDNLSLSSPLFAPGTETPITKDRHDHVASASTPLTTYAQVILLKTVPLDALLHVKNYQTIIHNQPLGSREARQPIRHAANAAQCYAELSFNDLTYTRIYAHGHSLKSMIVFHDFGSGDSPVRSLGTVIDSKLTVPVKNLDETGALFKADAEAAFSRSVQTFSGYLMRSRKQ